MFKSWAVWVSISLVGVMIVGILWGYRRDKRDEINYEQVKSEKNKLYVGLFLEPIETIDKTDRKQLYSSSKQLEL